MQARGKRQDALVHRIQPHQRGQALHVGLQQRGQLGLGAGALGLLEQLVHLGPHGLRVEVAVFRVDPVVQAQRIGNVVADKAMLVDKVAQARG